MVTVRPALKVASISQAGIVSLGAQQLGTGAKTVDSLISLGSIAGVTGAYSGAVSALSLALSGALTGATTGAFSGAVSALSLALSGAVTGATTGAFSGALSAGSLALSGAISGATTITASGAVGAASLSLSGAITGATTGAFSGAVSAGSLALSGAITGATTIAASGAATAASYTASGAVQGATVTATGVLTGASLTLSGAISGATTGTFSGALSASNLSGTHSGTSSGTNTGDASVSATANGLSVAAGQIFSLTAAGASTSGSVTSGVQTFGGAKTFNAALVALSLATSGGGLALSGGNITKGDSTTASITGSMVDGSSAVGVVLDTATAYSTGGAKLASIRNFGIEKSYFTFSGGLVVTGTSSGQTGVSITQGARYYTGPAGTHPRYISDDGTNLTIVGPTAFTGNLTKGDSSAITLLGTSADGAGTYGLITNTSVAFTNATAKLISVQNNSVEKSYFAFTGALFITAPTSGQSSLRLEQGTRVYLNGASLTHYFSNDGTNLVLTGIGYSGATLTLSGAFTSTVASAGNAISLTSGARIYLSGSANNDWIRGDTQGTVINGYLSTAQVYAAALEGTVANSSSAVAISFRCFNTLSTAGAKICVFSNDHSGTEKACVDLNGGYTSQAASGSLAFSQIAGARFYTNGATATRYISDNGSVITTTGGFTVGGNFTNTGFATIGTNLGVGGFMGYSTSSGLTANPGGGQAGALALAKDINIITVCATAGDSVLLPVSTAGRRIVVMNEGAASCNVFPPVGSKIDSLATDAAFAVAAGTIYEFFGRSSSTWRSR